MGAENPRIPSRLRLSLSRAPGLPFSVGERLSAPTATIAPGHPTATTATSSDGPDGKPVLTAMPLPTGHREAGAPLLAHWVTLQK